MDHEERDHLQKLLRIREKMLRQLELQAARFGEYCPPYIKIQIEELQDDSHRIKQLLNAESAASISLPIRSKYSFETGVMGWMAQDYDDSQACIRVAQSKDHATEGYFSLKMTMNLIGGDSNLSKGEAWVNWLDNVPKGERIPVDLADRTVIAWVYGPQGVKGEPSKPNGFQIFVKDEYWRGEYGPWRHAVDDEWVQVALTVSATTPKDGWMAQGFNPNRIIVIGVKMGSGTDSNARYAGPIYVDQVNW